MADNVFDQYDQPPGQSGNVFDQYDQKTNRPSKEEIQSIFANGPLKLGKEGTADSLRQTLQEAGWVNRNLAGVGSAATGLWEGAKQLVGLGNEQNIANNKVIEQAAPVGAFLGNAAVAAVPFGLAGKGIKAATGAGAVVGALSPVEGEQTLGNVVKGKLVNAAEGAVFGGAGQAVANAGGAMLAKALSDKAAQGVKNAPIDKTLKDAIGVGMVVPPTSVNPSLFNQFKEGVAGKIATAQTASNRNGEVIDSLARKSVGLGEKDALTTEAMQGVRRQAYQSGYEPISAIGTVQTDKAYHDAIDAIANKYQGVSKSFPGAVNDDVAKMVAPFRVGNFDSGDALKASQFLRDKANAAFRSGNNEEGMAAKGIAKILEDQIERTLQAGGQDGAKLLDGFRNARKLMAKSHTVEDAIVEGGGTINARKLAQRVQAGKPMSDELSIAGNFANNFPKATQPAQQVSGPGVSKLNFLSAMLAGGGGAMAGGVPGAAVGALTQLVAPPLMRKSLLSNRVQKGLVPSYGPTLSNKLTSALLQNSPVGLTALGLESLGQ